jgi:two-component system chemotaxis response regulator CheB
MYPDIIAIGTSVGGLDALRTIVADLPGDLKASVLIVQHLGPTSLLADLLSPAAAMKVAEARDGAMLDHGAIYVARPGRHFLVEGNGRIRLSLGPKENHARPAIDPLFRSVALTYGPRAIGVVLTGLLDDGTAGLQAIKLCGGAAVVQDPSDATAPSMPRSALAHVAVDFCLPVAGIGPLLVKLVATPAGASDSAKKIKEDLALENVFAAGGSTPPDAASRLGETSILTCPDCRGVLTKIRDERPIRFRCHTGHAFTARSLRQSLIENNENAVWGLIRLLQEESMLLQHMSSHAHKSGASDEARTLIDESRKALNFADQIRSVAEAFKRL